MLSCGPRLMIMFSVVSSNRGHENQQNIGNVLCHGKKWENDKMCKTLDDELQRGTVIKIQSKDTP